MKWEDNYGAKYIKVGNDKVMTLFNVQLQSSTRQAEKSHGLDGNEAEMPNGYLTCLFTSNRSLLATDVPSIFRKFQ
jgi:hypothetical protein